MKIKEFKYENKSSGLKINSITFNPDLTLLVGASGVGKSIILHTIYDLIRIADGQWLDGAEWEIKFLSDKEHQYEWKGAFETIDLENNLSKIKYEEIRLNDNIIVKREKENIYFEGNPIIPKLSSYKSVVNLFNEETKIKPIYEGISQIKIMNDLTNFHYVEIKNFTFDLTRKIEEIQQLQVHTIIKLFRVFKGYPETFNMIKEDFISIFNQIKDIRFSLINSKNIELPKHNKYEIQIQEKDEERWIPQRHISLGMLKTLHLISELYLCKDESVILIDEFENSLGINCIDSAVDSILHVDRNIQFIITSHHPYIINNIDMSHWKIVTRKGGVISTKNASDYGLDKYDSHHEAFLELIQLEDYSKGINS